MRHYKVVVVVFFFIIFFFQEPVDNSVFYTLMGILSCDNIRYYLFSHYAKRFPEDIYT